VRIGARIRSALTLRETPIGGVVPTWGGAVCASAAVAVVMVDLGLTPWVIDYDDLWPRIGPALAAMVLLAIAIRDPAGLGVRIAPLPSSRYWLRATIGIGLLFVVIVGIAMGIYVALHGMQWPANVPKPTWSRIPRSCGYAPVVEETIYRWVLVTGLAAFGLRWTAVLISGVAFGYLHVRYHVAAANNVAAGFVFAWMYLRSGAIAMPVMFHALGNLIVIAANVVGYHILVG
jgi:membrane protease YdiL (CAAX protease family)